MVVVCLSRVVLVAAAEKIQKKGKGGKDVASLSQEEQIALALGAAPAHVAKDASVLVLGAGGKLKEVKQGNQRFYLYPNGDESS